MEGIAQLTPLILIFVIFYFFLIRPQQKRVKDHKNMVAQLKRGDQVVTSGGIVGRIERILEDDKVELTIAENVNIKVVKSTIQSLSEKTEKKK
jgi:preprotein translocase subunit YajC